jgi:hypothetical protein
MGQGGRGEICTLFDKKQAAFVNRIKTSFNINIQFDNISFYFLLRKSLQRTGCLRLQEWPC